jgi:hypothetical protein
MTTQVLHSEHDHACLTEGTKERYVLLVLDLPYSFELVQAIGPLSVSFPHLARARLIIVIMQISENTSPSLNVPTRSLQSDSSDLV